MLDRRTLLKSIPFLSAIPWGKVEVPAKPVVEKEPSRTEWSFHLAIPSVHGIRSVANYPVTFSEDSYTPEAWDMAYDYFTSQGFSFGKGAMIIMRNLNTGACYVRLGFEDGIETLAPRKVAQ